MRRLATDDVPHGETTIPGTESTVDNTLPFPEITIVTITKNDPEGIRRTIASVEEQDFADYEHVVVHGGSTSEVAEWLALWRDSDKGRHILIDDPPDGIYPAMNAGIQSTSAPVIQILNGGDWLLPGALRRVSDSYKSDGWQWAYGGVEVRDPQGRSHGFYDFKPFSKWTFRTGLKNVPHTVTFATRDLYNAVGLYREDLGTGADQEFFLRACRVAKPGHISGILAAFETGGISSQETRIGRELSWHRMRVESGTAFGGGARTDLIMTSVLVALRFAFDAVRKVQRTLSLQRK